MTRRARPAAPPAARRRGRALAVLGIAAAVGVAAGATACVKVDAAPGGIASVRLDAPPPSVALGDTLRDTLGVPVRVHGYAYDPTGNAIPTASFRFSYVPTVPDTTAGAVADTALVVDTATGAVRATKRWVASSGRVYARLGTIAIADTIQIVPRADSVSATAPTDTVLRYSCADSRTGSVQTIDTIIGGFRNTAGPFTVLVTGDSAGTRVPVRRWYVRWSVDSVPAAIPTVPLTPSVSVPAIAVISGAADQVIGYDTTASSTGASSVRLRIRPPALGPSYFAGTTFRVALRADVIAGAGVPVRGSPIRGVFAIRLNRDTTTACAK